MRGTHSEQCLLAHFNNRTGLHSHESLVAAVRAQVGCKVLPGLQFNLGRGSDCWTVLRVEFYAKPDPIQCLRSVDLAGHQLSLHRDGGSLSNQLEVSSVYEWEVVVQ